MNTKEIKQSIRKYYKIHGNSKIILNNYNYTFYLRLGDCTTLEIPYPQQLVRELKLNELLK